MTEPATERIHIPSGDGYCAAWLTRAVRPRSSPCPIVVLVHGGGATHDMGLSPYERAFAEGGLAVLAFEFRHLGSSSGQPRGLLSVRRYLEDVAAVLDFVRRHPELDAERIALWGTSFGASHVVMTAAEHPEVAAAVVQCPIFSGRQVALRAGVATLAKLTGPIVADVIRAATGRSRRYVPIVGRPGQLAFVTAPGAWEGWYSLVGEGSTFENRVQAAAALDMLRYHAVSRLPDVRCPLLVCASDQENLIDPASVPAAAKTAPRGIVRHYPADHFQVYYPPLRDQIIADQLAFLTEQLTGERVS